MWKKKFPKITGMVSEANEGSPVVAPVGEKQPAMATQKMAPALHPMGVPSQLPAVPMLKAQPDMDEHTKRRALQNIAMGRKGF